MSSPNTKNDDFTKLVIAVDNISLGKVNDFTEFEQALQSAGDNEQRFELHGQIYDYVIMKCNGIKKQLHDMIDLELPEETNVSHNEKGTNTAKYGTWDFYILQSLNKEPKTENEVTEIIKDQYPHKFKGKTSDNTINYRLQKLVREGKAHRIEFRKGKRTTYQYFV